MAHSDMWDAWNLSVANATRYGSQHTVYHLTGCARGDVNPCDQTGAIVDYDLVNPSKKRVVVLDCGSEVKKAAFELQHHRGERVIIEVLDPTFGGRSFIAASSTGYRPDSSMRGHPTRVCWENIGRELAKMKETSPVMFVVYIGSQPIYFEPKAMSHAEAKCVVLKACGLDSECKDSVSACFVAREFCEALNEKLEPPFDGYQEAKEFVEGILSESGVMVKHLHHGAAGLCAMFPRRVVKTRTEVTSTIIEFQNEIVEAAKTGHMSAANSRSIIVRTNGADSGNISCTVVCAGPPGPVCVRVDRGGAKDFIPADPEDSLVVHEGSGATLGDVAEAFELSGPEAEAVTFSALAFNQAHLAKKGWLPAIERLQKVAGIANEAISEARTTGSFGLMPPPPPMMNPERLASCAYGEENI